MEINTSSCNTATLSPFVDSLLNPWNVSKIKHAYRRLGFSASQLDIDSALSQTPSQFIDAIVDGAINMPPTAAPFWADYSLSDFTDFETENEQYVFDWRLQAGNDFLTEGLRGRLAFFWTNHFVTELETYFYAPYLYKYYNLMQTYCIGNFKEFVSAIGKNSAMLLYLNGFENTNFNPNENYARELYELFTMGEGNGYTQQDIIETSRALTGYNHWADFGAEITFNASTFDDGIKIIFDQEGPWGYDDVITILFDERGTTIANTIITKLYKFLVSPTIDAVITQNVIEPLAIQLIDNNWELGPVLKTLLKSEHFFDERAVGVIVKSPFDIIYNFINETGFAYNDEIVNAFLYYAGLMGQEIFDPPDVAGWQRDETWINSSTLTGRWQLMELYLNYLFFDQELTEPFRQLAINITNDSNDPAFIARTMIDYFMSKELFTASDYDIATNILRWEIPQNYYDDMLWNLGWEQAPFQIYLLLKHIVRIPEFQLK